MNPKCPKCGANNIEPYDIFCNVCGANIYDESEEELPDYSSSIASSAYGCQLHMQISDLMDTFSSIAENDEEFHQRSQYIYSTLEETYKAAREQDEKIFKLEETQKDFLTFHKALEEYKILVDNRKEEPEYQKFLEKNPSILNPSIKTFFKKFPLAGELFPDFLLILHNKLHLFVEIEKPSKKMFNLDGTNTADFRNAIKQISDYTHWARENTQFLRERKCPDIKTTNIQGLLVIGNSDDLTDEQRKILERINYNVRGNYEIKTFDQIYHDRKHNVETFGFTWVDKV